MLPGGSGYLTQRPLTGEHRRPVNRGPDGVLDAITAPPIKHARIDQLIEYGAEMAQRRALLPGAAVRNDVGVLPRHRECGREQPWLLASEL
jgi:hypothetical protein